MFIQLPHLRWVSTLHWQNWYTGTTLLYAARPDNLQFLGTFDAKLEPRPVATYI